MLGSPAVLLFQAHRRGAAGVLRIQSEAGDARLWLDAGQVVWAEGVRLFGEDEDGGWPADAEPTGVLSEDLAAVIDRGMRVDDALEKACMAVGRYLGEVAELGFEESAWEEGVATPGAAFPLPWPALHILSRGLREVRHPDAVAAALQPHWDSPLTLDTGGEGGLRGLDGVALRTLKIATHLESLGELVMQSGRGQVERTRHAWRAIDLLLQLGLLKVGQEQPFDATMPLPDLSLSGPWRPDHEPELIAWEGPVTEFLPPSNEESPTAVLPDIEIEELAEPELPNELETDLQRLCALVVEVNPLAVLELDLDRLHNILTLAEVQKAFEAGARRLEPTQFEGGPLASSAAALAALLEDARESLREASIVAVWLRDLRRHSRLDDQVEEADRREAEANHRKAKELASKREWERALQAAVRATRLDPLTHRYRLVQVFCLVALRRLTPDDGVFNLDALELLDLREQAQAQVTAARLLKAARQPERARERFELALQLDPTRRDAKAELGR